jgi:hypothetical protein
VHKVLGNPEGFEERPVGVLCWLDLIQRTASVHCAASPPKREIFDLSATPNSVAKNGLDASGRSANPGNPQIIDHVVIQPPEGSE